MIKLVFTLRRRPGMTREEFQRYWRERHAPIVKRHAETLRIRRYVQVHARETEIDDALSASRGSEPGSYDGVAELWWDSVEDLIAAYSSGAGQVAGAELLEDERRFIDLPRSPLWLGEEHVVVDSR
jgi:uncharacterized protein (TIGR02118 family)